MRGKPHLRTTIVLFGIASIVACSAVRIETGQTREEAVESSEDLARGIRAEWATRIKSVSPTEIAALEADLIGQVVDIYVGFGRRVAEQWHEAESGRGEVVAAEEMRKMIDLWVEREWPILKAREDNIEYGADRLREDGIVSESALEAVNKLVLHMYEVYNAVFFPMGTLSDYEVGLDRAHQEAQRLMQQYRQLI
jgi:hypothetical protein